MQERGDATFVGTVSIVVGDWELGTMGHGVPMLVEFPFHHLMDVSIA